MKNKPIAEPDLEKIKLRNAIYYGIDKVELFHGIKDCLSNSKVLFASAQKIADGNVGYGTANSLLILAGEECVKAYVLLAVYFGKELEFEIRPYFWNHTTKHGTGKEILSLIKMVSITLSILGKGKKIEILLDIVQIIVGNTSDEKWWDSADNQKKNGFYVDLKNGKFHSPSQFNLEMYSNSNQIIDKY